MYQRENWLTKIEKHNTLSVDLATELASEGFFPQDFDDSRGTAEDILDPYGHEENVGVLEGLEIHHEDYLEECTLWNYREECLTTFLAFQASELLREDSLQRIRPLGL